MSDNEIVKMADAIRLYCLGKDVCDNCPFFVKDEDDEDGCYSCIFGRHPDSPFPLDWEVPDYDED